MIRSFIQYENRIRLWATWIFCWKEIRASSVGISGVRIKDIAEAKALSADYWNNRRSRNVYPEQRIYRRINIIREE